MAASAGNVMQLLEGVKTRSLAALLGWAMLYGAATDAAIAWAMAGPPVFDPRPNYWIGLFYLSVVASSLAFWLYYRIIRQIGPAKAAYSSVLVPIIAMGFSTWLENYRWTGLTIAGALLALGGMAAALRRDRSGVPAPDAA
jgi:drug/metabolite transporter (DMT)-like permease